MAANLNTVVICRTILTLENVVTGLNYPGIFVTLAPIGQSHKIFFP
jgi:hypothetical protein